MKPLTFFIKDYPKEDDSVALESVKFYLLKQKSFQTFKGKKHINKSAKNNKLKKRLTYRINQINNIKQKYRKTPNLAKNSYANRFLLKKNRRLYSKTILTPRTKSLSTTEEFDLFSSKSKAILREQRRHSFREKFQNFSRNKLLSNRMAKAAKVFITYKRKNTFVTIFGVVGENYLSDVQVVSKQSCGSIGFRNKKKTTDFASEQTIKAAGNYLNYNRYTSIDIIYTSNIPFPNRKVLNSLIPSPLYVRSLSFNRNRPQSYVRKKKAQRK